jgi:hypothetical protein
MDDNLVQTLTAPFAAGFVVQRFLEIRDPLTSKLLSNPIAKKAALGLISLLLGWWIAATVPIEIFHALLKQAGNSLFSPALDHLFSGIFISAGTEGFNSLMKFANYKKEASKADAASKLSGAPRDKLRQLNPQ